jgi:aryl-alcohol dehydrogenase-like predicted oxidoreductase
MMDRRRFLESLAGVTSGLLVSGTSLADFDASPRDRLGDLLPQRKLGRTGETVTMLGVGGWHIGRMNERDAQRTIEAALEGGVRFFDSAESYQGGRSERYFGQFLTPDYRDVAFLMTKTSARDADSAHRHLEGSLKRLNTDYLDLWQIHGIGSPDDVDNRLEQGVLDVARQAKENGKIRHIGFTGHRHPSAHLRMLERTAGMDVFSTCQMPINIADPSYNSFVEQVLPEVIDRGIGQLAMKTLANGGFFGGSAHGQHGDDPKVVPTRASIREALHFAWSLPISVLITGPDNVDQMKEKIELARSFTGMDESEREELIDRVADIAGTQTEFYKA